MQPRSLPLLLATALGCASAPARETPPIVASGLRQVYVAVDRIE